MAAMNTHTHVLQWLHAAHADLGAVDGSGLTPLEVSSRVRSSPLVRSGQCISRQHHALVHESQYCTWLDPEPYPSSGAQPPPDQNADLEFPNAIAIDIAITIAIATAIAITILFANASTFANPSPHPNSKSSFNIFISSSTSTSNSPSHNPDPHTVCDPNPNQVLVQRGGSWTSAPPVGLLDAPEEVGG